MINPILKNRTHLLAYLLFWVMLSIVHTLLLLWVQDQTWLRSIIEATIYSFGFAIIGLAIWFIVRFSGQGNGNLWNAVSSHLAGAASLIFVWLFGSYYLTTYFLGGKDSFWAIPAQDLWWRVALGIIYYLLVSLVYYLLIFYQNYKEKQIREIEMQSVLKETELNMLKAQINPHFIFNSLNSISSLTLTRPDDAHEMIVKLSTFLRYTIGHAETELVPLQKEIEAIQLYLEIEKLRFGSKLEVKIEGISDIPKSTMLPNLILQPLIENAIKYGVYESTEVSEVLVKLSFSDQRLYVTIVNSIEPDAVAKKGKGIGLKNVRGRLQLIYESSDLLHTNKADNQFKVELTIPQEDNQV